MKKVTKSKKGELIHFKICHRQMDRTKKDKKQSKKEKYLKIEIKFNK